MFYFLYCRSTTNSWRWTINSELFIVLCLFSTSSTVSYHQPSGASSALLHKGEGFKLLSLSFTIFNTIFIDIFRLFMVYIHCTSVCGIAVSLNTVLLQSRVRMYVAGNFRGAKYSWFSYLMTGPQIFKPQIKRPCHFTSSASSIKTD